VQPEPSGKNTIGTNMKKFSILFLLGITVLLSVANAQSVATAFDDYPVAITAIKKITPVKITDLKSKQYASMLKEASKHQPNFANHYILTSFGCGASCIMTAVINTKNGKVIWLPFTVCCWDLDVLAPLEFKRNSNLLIVKGSRDEIGQGTYYYIFENEEFKLLKSETKK
jgi:hypothetical protein